MVKRAAAIPLAFAPGTKWSYSNIGYLLLGVIIHRVTGEFYGDFLKENVFEPLGMVTTRIISEADIVPNRAAGYRLVKGDLKNQEWVSPTLNTTADGSLYLSVLDLAKWDASLYTDRMLKADSLKRMWTPVTLASGNTHPYGFGWALGDVGGHRLVEHGGAWQGFKSAIVRFPMMPDRDPARQSRADRSDQAGAWRRRAVDPALAPVDDGKIREVGAAALRRAPKAISTLDKSLPLRAGAPAQIPRLSSWYGSCCAATAYRLLTKRHSHARSSCSMSCGSRHRRRGLVRRRIPIRRPRPVQVPPLALAVTVARDTGSGRDRWAAGGELFNPNPSAPGTNGGVDLDQR